MMTKKTMKPLLGVVGVTALSFGAMLGITTPAFADAGAPVAPVASVTTASPADITPLYHHRDVDITSKGENTTTSTATATGGSVTTGNGVMSVLSVITMIPLLPVLLMLLVMLVILVIPSMLVILFHPVMLVMLSALLSIVTLTVVPVLPVVTLTVVPVLPVVPLTVVMRQTPSRMMQKTVSRFDYLSSIIVGLICANVPPSAK
jgi:hypothetical protein